MTHVVHAGGLTKPSVGLSRGLTKLLDLSLKFAADEKYLDSHIKGLNSTLWCYQCLRKEEYNFWYDCSSFKQKMKNHSLHTFSIFIISLQPSVFSFLKRSTAVAYSSSAESTSDPHCLLCSPGQRGK